MRHSFPKGDSNPAKRLEIRQKIREGKLGSKNPNWKPKIQKICLECNSNFESYPCSKQKYCSQKCSRKATSKRMKQNNPMKNKEVVSKVFNTQRSKGYFCNGGIIGGLWREKPEQMFLSVKKQMTEHNPMHNKTSLQKAVKNRDYKIIAQKNKISVTRFCRANPEKTPNRIMARQQFMGKGYISKQQWLMYGLTKAIFSDAEINHAIITNQSIRYADVAIPSKQLCLEFDSHYWHEKQKEQDKIRDLQLKEVGWNTIRFFSLKNLGDVLYDIYKN